jgi:peptidoglycan/LPS O-acetylase OafA/YrhL
LSLTYRDWFVDRVTRTSYREFLQRRFARIYPLHAFMLLLVVAMVGAAHFSKAPTNHGLERFQFSTLPQHFLLVQAWGPFVDGPGEWNPPSWSVSIEVIAYLLMPLWLWLTAAWARSHPWRLVAITVAAGCGLNALTHWGLAGFPAVSRGLCEFALGCSMANLNDRPLAEWLRSPAGAWCVAVIALVGFALTPDTGFVIALLTAPLLLTLAGGRNIGNRMFGWGPIFFLGEISYSIYLGHFLFSSVAYRVVSVHWMQQSGAQTLAGIAAVFTCVLIPATICYYAIERPGRDWLRGKRKRPRSTPAADTVGTPAVAVEP